MILIHDYYLLLLLIIVHGPRGRPSEVPGGAVRRGPRIGGPAHGAYNSILKYIIIYIRIKSNNIYIYISIPCWRFLKQIGTNVKQHCVWFHSLCFKTFLVYLVGLGQT